MKKLIPTILMTACGLAAVGGGSYAWFTKSNTVTANNLSIKATVDSSLGIASGYIAKASIASVNQSEVDMDKTLSAVNPCHIEFESGVATVKIPETFETQPTTSSAGSVGETGTWKNIGTMELKATDSIVNEDDSDKIQEKYVATDMVTVARRGTDGIKYNLGLEGVILFGDEASQIAELDKAIRVGVMEDTTGTVAFASVSKEGTTLSGSVKYTFGPYQNLVNNEVYHFRLMVWYEGESTSCNVAAASVIIARAVNFTFTATDVVA